MRMLMETKNLNVTTGTYASCTAIAITQNASRDELWGVKQILDVGDCLAGRLTKSVQVDMEKV